MNADSTVRVACPYCGERIRIVVDGGADAQTYIEDCEVCCRPIVFEVWRDAAGDWGVAASREDDA
ncbi:MAG: CPXCG motif-containing cysteine-rich protein [Thermomonas sp.]